MSSPLWICKKNEIVCHVKRLFEYYEEDLSFFDEYLDGVLKHDIDEALRCFRDLVKQLDYLPRKEPKDGERLQGMSTKFTSPQRPRQFQPTYRRRT